MADVSVKSKEAIVIVFDVGRSMHYESKQIPTVLSNSKTCVSMILQRKIFAESKDELALVLFGTHETANNLHSKGSLEYKNIKVVQDLRPAGWDLLKYINQLEGTELTSDFIDALVVAMDILHRENESKHFTALKILFFSNFDADFCKDQVNAISSGIKNNRMELIVVGPCSLDDDEASDDCQKYRMRTPKQIKAETVMQQILKEVNGKSYSFEEAIPALIYYQKKHIQSLPWNATLDIGKDLIIPISAYIKISESKAKPWKSAYAHELNAKIEKETTFHLNDISQTVVAKENIIPAYRFGTTLVPFSEEDKVNMQYTSGEKGMKVLGFTKEEKVHRYYFIGDKTMFIFGQKNRDLADVILAPFIQALYETKMVAIVRYVYSSRAAPKIGFLAPRIKPNKECLVYITLPFMEDFRHYVFSPLDSDSRNLPTDEQLAAVDELISTMDLSVAVSDDEGNPIEGLKPKNTVNPSLQRMYQCLQAKVFHPDATLPEIPQHIKTVIEPCKELIKAAEPAVRKIKRLFPLNDSAKRKLHQTASGLFSNGKSEGRSEKMMKEGSFDEDAAESIDCPISGIGTVNPVKDFKSLVSLSGKNTWFAEICKQLEGTVLRFISDERINVYHDKIISCLCEYRAASLRKDEPFLFNLFMKSLKGTIISHSPELWTKIQAEKISLINLTECCASTVTFQEAMEFIENVPDENSNISQKKDDEEEDDLLAEL